MSLPATIPTGRAVVADELHWKAILRLGCIEGHIGVALFGDAGKDPSLRPWLFLILMELTVAYCNPGFRSLWSASEELHTTGAKQLKKLGELLNHVLCRDGNLSVDVLPESCFHPTVQNHIVMHLLKCITGANQVRISDLVYALLFFFLKSSGCNACSPKTWLGPHFITV